MDWLRRNWPDLLIGVALVAVIAGIIATLISGGSFFPFGQGSGGSTPSTPITTPSTQSSTQGATPTQPGSTQPGAAGGEATGTTGTGPATDAQPGSDTSTGTTGTPAGAGTDQGIAVLPPSGTASGAGTSTGTDAGAGSTAGTEPAAGESAAQPDPSGGVTALPPAGSQPSSAGTASPAAPSATSPSTPSSSAASTPPSGAAPAAASADADEVSYRVSVGAFGNEENAQRLGQQFQGAGYPVLLGTQGNLTIVLLGPYATDSEARRVADQVDGTFGVIDPTVYRYEPEPGDTPATAGTAPGAAPGTSSTTASSSTASTSGAQAPAASASGRYLQVGAYANRESSMPQRDRLEGLGFTVTEVQEGQLLKLLVGPYQGGSLTEAQSTLAAEGIENFARGL